MTLLLLVQLTLFLAGTSAAATVLRAPSQPDVKITYQKTRICETTPNVNAYSGYVTLPASLDPTTQPYDAKFFFWFFEGRKSPQTAPLTLWLQGGPGLASTTQAVSGHNGPCIVQRDSNSTLPNPWSWNGVSNMLYLDQPVQTGYSYDQAKPGYRDMVTADVTVGATVPASNLTIRKGVFASQVSSKTADTTGLAARAVAHFLEAWFQEFRQYSRGSINIWSQSYGGHYAPAIATLLRTGTPSSRSFKIGINSVGIINGNIDLVLQTPYYPVFAVNNTYDIKAYSDAIASSIVQDLSQPGGCLDQGRQCQALQRQYDPQNLGKNQTVNDICFGTFLECYGSVFAPYLEFSGRNQFDIGHLMPDSFPPPYAEGFLNNDWVQRALGAQVNYTDGNNVVANNFAGTGDFVRGYTKELAHLLNAGVKVALIYGDRDYTCNWLGGEAVSLAIPYTGSAAFANAGYQPLLSGSSSASRIAGFVRQRGLYSFSRVFQAGHEVPYYQPAAALNIFARTIAGRDVATGLVDVNLLRNLYSTAGPASVAGVKSGPPARPQGRVECYVDHAPLGDRCSERQVAALVAGTAVVGKDRVVVSPAS